ncbi:MAG: class I SAM-dependent methyltransferase [Oscillospiraceae bacterium]
MAWKLVWDEIYQTQGNVQYEVLPTAVMAAELFKRENVKTILDLGCGMGRHSIFLARQGFQVTATDISPKGVETTRQKATELGLEIETACHDMRDIPFTDNTFDAVFCIWTSGHGTLDDMTKHAHEMLRVVKTGGYVFVDYVSKEDELFGVGTEIESNTFLNNTPGEEEIPHHYSDEQEIRALYAEHDVNIKPFTYSFKDSYGNTHYIKANIVICRK